MATRWRVSIDVGGGRRVGQLDLTQNNFPAGGSDIDEVVIGGWFHLERMDDDEYMLIVGGRHNIIEVKDGQAKIINMEE